MSAIKAAVPTKRVPITFKLTIKEDFESDQPLIKAKFTSLDPTKSVYFCGTP